MFKKQLLFLFSSLLVKAYTYNSSIYTTDIDFKRIDFGQQSVYINPITQKGFTIQTLSTINNDGYPDVPEHTKKFHWSIPTLTFPNPSTGKMVSVHAKDFGLFKFNLIKSDFNPFYYLSTAKISDKKSHQALYLIDYHQSKVTSFTEKNTNFYAPILNKQCLYYGFADKNHKPYIYRICSKSKKIQLFPIDLSRVERWSVTGSGERIVGYGKLNQNTVLFTFDTTNLKKQLLYLTQLEGVRNFKITEEDLYFHNYKPYISYLNYGTVFTSSHFIHILGTTTHSTKKFYYWDTKTNKLTLAYQFIDEKKYPDSSLRYCSTKNKNIFFYTHFDKDILKINQFNKQTLITKTLLLSDIHQNCRNFISFCNYNGNKFFIQLLDNEKQVIYFYLLDFEKENCCTVENLPSQFYIYSWMKDYLWVFGTNKNGAFKIDYSTCVAKKYPWELTEYIFYPLTSWSDVGDNSYSNVDNVLCLTNQHQFCWFNAKTEEIKKLPFTFTSNLYTNKSAYIIGGFLKPDLKGHIGSFFTKPNKFSGHFEPNPKAGIVGKINVETGVASILKVPSLENISFRHHKFGRSFEDKNGFHFLQFDEKEDLVLDYLMPYHKVDLVFQKNEFLVHSKKEKEFLLIWIIDTKKHLIRMFKIPQKIPAGYFDLKKYIVKQNKSMIIPNQKWESIH